MKQKTKNVSKKMGKIQPKSKNTKKGVKPQSTNANTFSPSAPNSADLALGQLTGK